MLFRAHPQHVSSLSICTGLALATLAWCCSPTRIAAQQDRVVIDGFFGDWLGREPLYTDPAADATVGRADLGRLWAAHDEHHLFLRLELGVEISLQESRRLKLYLDTDNNTSTGIQDFGAGAELVWDFGSNSGLRTVGGRSVAVTSDDIGFVSAPTVTSREFELAVARSSAAVDSAPLLLGSRVRITVADQAAGGDIAPNPGDTAVYSFVDTPPLPSVVVIPLEKQSPDQVRILSYNLNNHLTDPERAPALERILRAVQPDILALQEIRDQTALETGRYLTDFLPPAEPAGWQVAKAGPEVMLLSRFPIVAAVPIEHNGAFLVDLLPTHSTELLLVIASTPCCRRNTERQMEIDAIMAFIRNARDRHGALELRPRTPIAIVGDVNLVGYSRQLRTLLEGTIFDVGRFGPAFAPDWDGSSFVDLVPRHTHSPFTYTWRGRDFPPGRLDYVIYSDSVLEFGNRFVLYTPDIPPSVRAAHGLKGDDVPTVSDHLPLVADFKIRPQ